MSKYSDGNVKPYMSLYYILTTEQGQGSAGNETYETTSAVQTRRGDGEPFPT